MKKLCLIILDGYGIANTYDDSKCGAYLGSLITGEKQEKIELPTLMQKKGSPYDAVCTSTYDKFRDLFTTNPYTLLNASSFFVGLPHGQMGNSEVGHLNIGAGKVVEQDLIRINNSIDKGEFNEKLDKVIIGKNNKLHLICLVSNGCVHSNIEHLFACLDYYSDKDNYICIHFISDGRDTDPHSAILFAKDLKDKISGLKNADKITIATLSGRYYAMDREKNFDRTTKYFNTITKSASENLDIEDVINKNYEQNITDEFIEPINLSRFSEVANEDTVIVLNYRADRVRQITQMLLTSNMNLKVYTMTSYNDEFVNAKVLFEPIVIKENLSAFMSRNNLKQLKVAEQSKYAHVTYFLNGGIENPYRNEDRVLVDMVNAKTFDLKPKMSAKNVYKVVKSGMQEGYDFIAVNFANCDMVGHTGVLSATQIAVNTVTKFAYKLTKYGKLKDYIVVITADHGNAEIMKNGNNVNTAHTTNKVPFIITNYDKDINLKPNGSLCNIMPTIIELMGLDKM